MIIVSVFVHFQRKDQRRKWTKSLTKSKIGCIVFLWLMLILFLFWFFVNQKCRYPKNSVSIPVLYHHWNSRTFTKLNFLSEYRILTSHSNSLVVLEFKSTTLFNCIRKVYILLQVLKWNKLFSKSTHCLSKHFLLNENMILQRMTH